MKYITDMSDVICSIPVSSGLLNQLPIFKEEFHTNSSVVVGNVVQSIPHFPLSDSISSEASDEELADKTMIPNAIMQTTIEFAKIKCLFDGEVYIPNETVEDNLKAQFTRTKLKKLEEVESYFKSVKYEGTVLAVCSKEAFNKLLSSSEEIGKAYVRYQHESIPSYLVSAVGESNDRRKHRVFQYGNVVFIEYRSVYRDIPLVKKDMMYFFPAEEKVATIHYAPANYLSTINTEAKKMYMFTYLNDNGDTEIEVESNFVCALDKPELVVELKY